jgi:RNA-binding protein YhbY
VSKTPARIIRAAKARELKVTVRVGKSGLTEAIVGELAAQLEGHELIKAKLNRGLAENSEERAAVWASLAEGTNSTVVHSRGNVAVFYRK